MEGRGLTRRQLAGSLSITYEIRDIPAAKVDAATSSISALATAGTELTAFVDTLKQSFADAGQLSPTSLTAVFIVPTTSEYQATPRAPAPRTPAPSGESRWYDDDWKLYSTITGGAVGLLLVIALLFKLRRPKHGQITETQLSMTAEKLWALATPTITPAHSAIHHHTPAHSAIRHRAPAHSAVCREIGDAEQEINSQGNEARTEVHAIEGSTGKEQVQKLEQPGASVAGSTPAVARAHAGVVDTSLLPAGWQAINDPKSGKMYYCNTLTRESVWTVPTEPAVVNTIAEGIDPSVAQQASTAHPISFFETEKSLQNYRERALASPAEHSADFTQTEGTQTTHRTQLEQKQEALMQLQKQLRQLHQSKQKQLGPALSHQNSPALRNGVAHSGHVGVDAKKRAALPRQSSPPMIWTEEMEAEI
jgi:hypothetical protein